MTMEIIWAMIELAKSQKSTLYLDCSRYAEVSGAGISGTLGEIRVKDSSNSTEQWFEFGGFGVGLSIGLPDGFSYSKESYDSWGGQLYKGPSGFGKLNYDDLTGAGHLITISGVNAGEEKGSGLSIFTMGEVYGQSALCSAVTVFTGTVVMSPNAGAYIYTGMWRKK